MTHHLLSAAQESLLNAAREQTGHSMSLGIAPSDVHIDKALSAFAVGYSNDETIADLVCPVIPVQKESDKYWVHDKYRAFNVANVSIASQRGRPGEVNTSISKDSYKTEDYGLTGFVTQQLIDNADAPLDPLMMEVDTIMQFLSLARELRVAELFTTAANYGSNTAALAGTDKFTNASSDPADKINTALDSCLVRPNIGIIGLDAFRALQKNAKLRAYIEGRESTMNGATPMRPTAKLLAEVFELDAIYVPKVRYNTANSGQTASLSRVWTADACAFVRVEKRPSMQKTGTFAYTFRVADSEVPPMAVQQWFDRSPGRKGGTWVKVTHADDEKLIAGADAGYLLTACT